MKTYRALLLLFALLLTASLHAQNDTLRILAIGNSFADDGIEYLDEVARSAGKHIIVANTYIGGCSIARHLDNARHDRPAYLYRKNIDGKYTEEHDKTLHDAIRDEAWDYIVFQQVSDLAGQYGTYFPDLAELMDYVRPLATNPTCSMPCNRPGPTPRTRHTRDSSAMVRTSRPCTTTWYSPTTRWPSVCT